MSVKVGFNHLIKRRVRRISEQTCQVSAEGDKIGLELSHGVLSQAPCAEAHTLAEGTDPALVFAAFDEVALVLSLHAERAKLTVADVIFFLETAHALSASCDDGHSEAMYFK